MLLWLSAMSQAGEERFDHLLFGDQKRSFIAEMVRWSLGKRRYTLPALGLAWLNWIDTKFSLHLEQLLHQVEQLRQHLQSVLSPSSILLFPSYPCVAPKHNVPLLTPRNFSYSGIVNILGFPSTQVPIGLNQAGIPMGIQVIGGVGMDARTIEVAKNLEAEFGGWQPPGNMIR